MHKLHKGPRVTVVRSDAVLAEAELQFHLKVLSGGRISRPLLETLLEYGTMMGLGQWRSGAWGSFELVDLETVDELPARVRNPAPIRPPVKPEAPQVPVEEDAPTGPGKSNKEKGR